MCSESTILQRQNIPVNCLKEVDKIMGHLCLITIFFMTGTKLHYFEYLKFTFQRNCKRKMILYELSYQRIIGCIAKSLSLLVSSVLFLMCEFSY